MSNISPISKGRQMMAYFQEFGELPDVKKEPVEYPETGQYLATDFARELDFYRDIDNSPVDYDPRPGHLLLGHDELCENIATQVSFQSADGKTSMSRLFLEEDPMGGCFSEEHFLLTNQKLHTLTFRPITDSYHSLTATQWNIAEPYDAQRQHVEFWGW